MSSTTADFASLIAEAQREAITSLRQAGDLAVRAAETVVGLSSLNGRVALDAGVPWAMEAVESAFGFTSQLLDVQKTYALKLADALSQPQQQQQPKTKS